MKIYSCVLTIAVNDEVAKYNPPAKWNWVEVLGTVSNGLQSLDVYDVTEHDVERVRLTANGTEDI